nr:aminopeptidase P family N-terminal domain-containing protein [uncultured Desulfobulbus sp.]
MNDQKNESTEIVPRDELHSRAEKLRQHLRALSLDGALLLDPLTMYYFTGTLQQGIVVIPVEKNLMFFVRRNIERARMESSLSDIRPLAGLSQLAKALREEGIATRIMGLATAQVTMDSHEALKKALPSTTFVSINKELAAVRAVKSPYEISLIRRAGERHRRVYDQIPAMIQENMSEWELGCKIQTAMMELGYTGMPKLSGENMEIFLGYVSAGISANYPTGFSGPGGAKGLSPTIPYVGSRKKIQTNEPIYR